MQLVAIGRNPVPTGAEVGVLETDPGVKVRFARWAPTHTPHRGTVCILPGRNEFIEKYFETVADMRRRGFAVAVLDWRGQGGSSRLIDNPRKGHIEDFSQYDRDLAQFMVQGVLPHCSGPYYALAHSMGAHILLRNGVRAGDWFDRMVVTAPMLAINPELLGYPVPVVSWYAETARWLGFGESYAFGNNDDTGLQQPFEGNSLTSDPERFSRNQLLFEVAPYLAVGGPTVSWLAAALRSIRTLAQFEHARAIRVPTLLVSAGQDRIVDASASAIYFERMKSAAIVVLTDSRHEILQERDELRSQFWAVFDAYLGKDAIAA